MKWRQGNRLAAESAAAELAVIREWRMFSQKSEMLFLYNIT